MIYSTCSTIRPLRAQCLEAKSKSKNQYWPAAETLVLLDFVAATFAGGSNYKILETACFNY